MTATITPLSHADRLAGAKRSVATKERAAAKKLARSKAPRTKPAVPSKATRFQQGQGALFGGLAVTLLGMSLDHLATGIQAATHVASWEGWTMALAIDVGFVAAELMPFTARAETVRETQMVRHGLTGVVLAASAWFNTVAFSDHGTVSATSAVIGASVPLAIGTFIYLASRCLIGKAK